LDLSFNPINSSGLLESMKHLPSGLATLNLSGCPCAQDEATLQALQDAFPDLGIAIEEDNYLDHDNEDDKTQPVAYDHTQTDDNDNNSDNDYIEIENSNISNSNEPVDADEILRYIVQRKCRLQAEPGPINLTTVLSDLKREEEAAVNQRSRSSVFAHRLATLREGLGANKLSESSSVDSKTDNNSPNNDTNITKKPSTTSAELARRIAELVANNRQEGEVFTKAMSSLKQTAKESLAQLDAWRAERMI
jgi:hypothetical protein